MASIPTVRGGLVDTIKRRSIIWLLVIAACGGGETSSSQSRQPDDLTVRLALCPDGSRVEFILGNGPGRFDDGQDAKEAFCPGYVADGYHNPNTTSPAVEPEMRANAMEAGRLACADLDPDIHPAARIRSLLEDFDEETGATDGFRGAMALGCLEQIESDRRVVRR